MGRAARTVAVAVRVEDRLQLLLQQHRCRRLRHPVGHIRHPEDAHALPVILGYLHRPHRAREVAPRRHPVPQLVEVVPLPLLKPVDADGVHARSPVVGPDPLPRPKNQALVDLKRLHFRLGCLPRLLPRRVGLGLPLVCAAPWLQPHYRTFIATTSRPVPVPRIGTLPLTVDAAWGPPFRDQGVNNTHFDWPTASGRLVLLFRISACDELTPPLHRAPPGQHTGHRLAEGAPSRRAFVTGTMRLPAFGTIVSAFDASDSGSLTFVFSSPT